MGVQREKGLATLQIGHNHRDQLHHIKSDWGLGMLERYTERHRQLVSARQIYEQS